MPETETMFPVDRPVVRGRDLPPMSVRADARIVRPLLGKIAQLSGERHGDIVERVLSEEFIRLSTAMQSDATEVMSLL